MPPLDAWISERYFFGGYFSQDFFTMSSNLPAILVRSFFLRWQWRARPANACSGLAGRAPACPLQTGLARPACQARAIPPDSSRVPPSAPIRTCTRRSSRLDRTLLQDLWLSDRVRCRPRSVSSPDRYSGRDSCCSTHRSELRKSCTSRNRRPYRIRASLIAPTFRARQAG
jgi:hypothetical protein